MQIDHESEAERLEREADNEAELLGSKPIGRDYTLPIVVALIAVIVFLAFLYFGYVGQRELPSDFFTDEMGPKERFELRGLFGDQWGAFTGIISGLSFTFVALSLFAQRSELRMSRRELSMQRVELKYTRAQSHRQLFELRMQRQEEERRGVFQKEPIVLVNKASLVPINNGAEIHLHLDHFGPAACNLEIDVQFSGGEVFNLLAPQIIREDTKLCHSLAGAYKDHLRTFSGDSSKIILSFKLKYRNLAGGCFLCEQEFSISNFALKSALLTTDNEPREFVVVSTSFRQTEVIRFGTSKH